MKMKKLMLFHVIVVISPNFMVWKFCRKTQFPHREIRWNYDVLRSGTFYENSLRYKVKSAGEQANCSICG